LRKLDRPLAFGRRAESEFFISIKTAAVYPTTPDCGSSGYTVCRIQPPLRSERIMSNTLALVVLLALSSIASAQSSGAITPSPPPSNSEIKRLVEALSGTWSITLKIEPNESLPKGGGGKGEEVWRPGPGGLSLIEDYHSTGDEGEISGLGVEWWDSDAQRYQVTWCDSGNPGGCAVIKHGAKWEGSKVVAMDEWQENGKMVTLREVFSDITPTSFKQTLYQGESGGELKMFLSILAVKVR
jgi:hypothetical protein